MKKVISRILVAAITLSVLVLNVGTASAASFTSSKDTMERLQISTPSAHTVVFTLPTGVDFDSTTQTDILRVDFPATFSQSGTWLASEFTLNDGTARTSVTPSQGAGTIDCTVAAGVNNFCVAIDTTNHIFSIKPSATYTASATAATITFTIAGSGTDGVLTNPATDSTTSQKVVSLASCDETASCTTSFTTSHSSSVALGIIDDDTVEVTASVDPSLVFDMSTGVCPVDNAAPYSVALGTLSTTSVSTAASHICMTLDTNADAGAVVTVNGLNGGLTSAAAGYTIDSASETLTPGGGGGTNEGFGLCVDDTNEVSGGPIVAVAPFNGTCASHVVGEVTTGDSNIANTSGALVDGTEDDSVDILVKALISPSVPAATDYREELTFIATGTF